MFTILLNTCAIPDGFVTYGARPKCSKCQGYTQATIYSSPFFSTSSISSPPLAIKREDELRPNLQQTMNANLPDIIASHAPVAVTDSDPNPSGGAALLTQDQRARVPRERVAPVSSRRRLASREASRSSRNESSRTDNPITGSDRCQSLSRRKDFGSDPTDERSPISPIGLDSTCLDICCNDWSSPRAANRIDYVNVGFKLRLIADNFQSKSPTGTTASGMVSMKLKGQLPHHFFRYFSLGLIGVAVISLIRWT